MKDLVLSFASPETFSVQGQLGFTGDNHIDWYVDYAPEPDKEFPGRVVFGTIHALNDGVATDVTIAATFTYAPDREPSNEEFEAALRDSDAVECLWDTARLAFGAVGGVMGNRAELPRKAPEPTIGQLQARAEDVEDDPSPEENASL